jgi:hypothetical protein
MTLAYGWVLKIQKRIAGALVYGQLTKWEMQFLQTIDNKLETYQTDAKLIDSQHRRLFMILSRAEKPRDDQVGLAKAEQSVELAGGPPPQTDPISLQRTQYRSISHAPKIQDRTSRPLVRPSKINTQLIRRTWEFMQETKTKAGDSKAPPID